MDGLTSGVRGPLGTRILRYILVRLFVATAMLGYVGVLYVSEAFTGLEDLNQFLVLVGGLYLVLGLSAGGLAWSREANPVVYSAYQVICDTAVVTGVVYTFGGVHGPFTLIYAACVVGGARLDYRRGAILSAFLNSAAVLGLGLLETRTLQTGDLVREFALLSTNILGFFLVALLSGELAQRLRVADEELAQQTGRAEALAADLSQVLGSIRSGLALFDASGQLRSANATALQFFPELGGRAVDEIVEGFDEALDRVWEIRTGEDEHRRDLLLTRSSIEDGASVLTIEDITDLRAMQHRIAREERLAAVGRLSAGIAHEIRNPLTSLSGAIQLLDLSEGDQRLRQIITREVDRLSRLVTDFMHAGSPPELRLVACNLRLPIEEVMDTFRADPRYAGSIEVVFNHRQLPVMLVDRDQLKMVLWNLLLNAAQHMPGGGRIDITAEHVGDRVRFLVSDQGTGIPADEIDRIFDPFWTRRSGGTGLGLATVERVTRQHGGDVWVHSKVGGGTTFGIYLPVRLEDERAANG